MIERFTTGMIASIVCVAPQTVSKWIDGKLLKGFTVPPTKQRNVLRADLLAFMDEHGIPRKLLDVYEAEALTRRTYV